MSTSTCKVECEKARVRIQQVDFEIYEIISSKNAKTVIEQMGNLDTMDGKFSQLGMWKVRKKLCPRQKDPPTAKKDEMGNLITAPTAQP